MSKKFGRSVPACAIIFNDNNQVLLSQRYDPDQKWHAKWNFPGGGIDLGEDPKNAAIRETLEEVGINVEIISDFPIVVNHADKNANEDYVCIVYIAKYLNSDFDVSKDDGTSDAKWFNIEDINYDDCLPLTKEIIEKAKTVLN